MAINVGQQSQPWETFYKRATSHAPCVDTFVAQLPRPEHATVLDLGCGTGRNVGPLVRAGMRVIAVDINEPALETARERLAQYGDVVGIEAMSMLELCFPDCSFDGVIAVSVLNHGTRAEVDRAFSEVRRVLVPGGLLLVTMIATDHPTYRRGIEIEPDTFVLDEGVDAGVPHRFFTVESFQRFLGDAGFDALSVRAAGIADIKGVNDGHILAFAQAR